MSVSIKTAQEIELMRESGHLLEKVHDGLIPYIKPGMSTKEIDRIGEDMIRSMGCIPNFLNYGGFPGSFCISLNDEVVHGIPSEDKIIQDGDLVKIDAGLIYKGYHSDAARTYAVGEVSKEAKQLMDVTRQCFFEGIKFAKAGNHLNDISKAIGAYAAKYRYGIVRDLVGHGDWYPSPRGSADSQLPSETQGSEITSRHDTCHRAHDQYGQSRCMLAG